jgi:hypothetical protein
MPESKARKTVAVLLSVGLGLLIALVMLFPIGGDTRSVGGPGSPTKLVPYYWSLGSFLLLGPVTGGFLQHLNIGSILVGVVLSVLAGVLPYRFVMTRGRDRT